MQIFSEISAVKQIDELAKSQSNFNFGMPLNQGKKFYNVLQQTVQDIAKGSINNKEISEKLDFIEKNISDELMTKIEEEINFDSESNSKEEELSAKAFAILNLLDNILETLDKINNEQDLTNSMAEKGVSEMNINTAVSMLDNSKNIIKSNIVSEEIINQNLNNTINKEKAIAQFNSNKFDLTTLSEKIISGQDIDINLVNSKNENNKLINNEQLFETTEEAIKQESSNKEAQTLNQLLSLFKKTKEEAISAGLNINNKGVNKNEKTSDILNHAVNKTKSELTKSEFKELNNKFISAEMPDSSNSENLDLLKNNSQEQLNSIKNLVSNKQPIELFEAKNISNFNHQLYKVAQQANTNMQINIALKEFKDKNMQQLKIKLNPQELGSITIDMEMIDGASRGIIMVERPEVAQQLAQSLKDIFQGFKNTSLDVDVKDIVVKVGSEHKQQQRSRQNNENVEQNELEFIFNEDDILDIQV